jgi:S1-C subfamily serine protease
MSEPEVTRRSSSRETRLLLVTIAVSVGVLLLLARYRFPDEAATQTVPSAPAPLERLAARAVYDELASTMADLERRIVPRIVMARVQDARGESWVVAPRLLPDRAVAVADAAARVANAPGTAAVEVVGRDEERSLAVLRVPAMEDGAVTIRQGTPRVGPRYVAVVDASSSGPMVRPAYVARIETRNDSSGRPILLLTGLQQPMIRGSAVFALEGAFLGLVREGGSAAVVVPAETLPAVILNGQATTTTKPSTLGLDVDTLTPALARATGAKQGVVIVRVHPGGPAAEVLQTGDVIASVDGTAVPTPEAFRRAERTRTPGATVSIVGTRRREPLEFTLRADPVAPAPAAAPGSAGFVGRNAPGAGIEVVAVDEGGPAAAAGLLRGDLIRAVDGEPARDADALTRRFRAAAEGTAILLTIQRDQLHRVLALEKQ